MNTFALWGLSALVVVIGSLSPNRSHADIFGIDNRVDANTVSYISEERRAVAVSVLESIIKPVGNGQFEIETDNVSEFLCPDERFADQSSVPYACTGFLVAPDLLVTAGHCSTHYATQIRREPELYCETYKWVFDYKKTERPWLAQESAVYSCKKILYAVYDGKANQRDFALIQLDRPVTSREPLKISHAINNKNDSVFILGHPLGLPMKYAGGAKITDDLRQQSPSLMTNLDAFAGNSGSPVFNRKKEVIGVLVGGSPNRTTYHDESARCERYNRCDEDGTNCIVSDGLVLPRGLPETFSEVQKISNYLPIIDSHKNRIEQERQQPWVIDPPIVATAE